MLTVKTTYRAPRPIQLRFAAAAVALLGAVSLTQALPPVVSAASGPADNSVVSLLDTLTPHELVVADGITRTTYSSTTENRVVRVVVLDPDRGALSLGSTVGRSVSEKERTTGMLATVGSSTRDRPYVGVNGGFSMAHKGQDADHDLIAEERSVATGVSVQGDVVQGASCTDAGESVVLQHGRAHITQVATELSLTSSDGAGREIDGVNRYAGWLGACRQGADDRVIPHRTDAAGKPVLDAAGKRTYLDEFGRDIEHNRYYYEDDSEIVVFTSAYGDTTPAAAHSTWVTADNAPGVEVAVDARGVVVAVDSVLGGMAVPPGGKVFQGIGNQVPGAVDPRLGRVDASGGGERWLREHATLGTTLTYMQRAKDVRFDEELPLDPAYPSIDVVNGTYLLLRNGKPQVEPGANAITDPRTAIGTDGWGRTLLVTVTAGTRAAPLRDGLGMADLAAVMQDLGAIDALNLDGGGSTTFVVDGTVRNVLSDATGERPVYDSVYGGLGGYGLPAP